MPRPRRPPRVIPAKAGIHRSATASPEAWTPAFAGVTGRKCAAAWSFPSAVATARARPPQHPPRVIPAKAGIHRSAAASPEAWTPAFAGVTGRKCAAVRSFPSAVATARAIPPQHAPRVIAAKAAIRCTYLRFGRRRIPDGILGGGRRFHLESFGPPASNIRSRKSLQLRYVHLIAAKAGVHAGTKAVVDKWTPAFAGVTILELGSTVLEP